MLTLYLLNTPVLTAYGEYRFTGPLNLSQAKELLAQGFVSAIGHQGTAELLSLLLEIPVPTHRVSITMQAHDRALVFRLTTRMPEGQVFTKEEISQLPFELGLLERIC